MAKKFVVTIPIKSIVFELHNLNCFEETEVSKMVASMIDSDPDYLPMLVESIMDDGENWVSSNIHVREIVDKEL